MTDIHAARAAEHAKYGRCYQAPGYHMKGHRMADAVRHLGALPRGSYLDVSTGRGEMLRHAEGMGFGPVCGTEVVPGLVDGERVVRAEAHALPFPARAFDVVSFLDVIEHLIPGDDALACRELERVACRHVLITANNRESWSGADDLHINKRSYDEWGTLFRSWFWGRVERLPVTYHSQMWLVTL